MNGCRIKSLCLSIWVQERISNIAYNVTNGECSPRSDPAAPVYITIGDGGNLEGLVYEYVLILFRY